MAQNKLLDEKTVMQLHQHYNVQPQPEFLPALKEDMMNRFTLQQPTQRKPRRWTFALACTLAALLIVLAVTPAGNALAQQFIALFQRAESDVVPIQSEQNLAPAEGADPASMLDAHLTIEEVEQAAGFDVLVPASLPDFFVFSGASYDPETQIVRLFYGMDDGRQDFGTNGLGVAQEPGAEFEACDLCSEVGASAYVEAVQIGAVTGEYVEGVWKLDNGVKTWEPDPYLQRLRWQTNGMAFELMYMGLPDWVVKEDLVEIAGGFQ